jgi:hypothetical protein
MQTHDVHPLSACSARTHVLQLGNLLLGRIERARLVLIVDLGKITEFSTKDLAGRAVGRGGTGGVRIGARES